jgi:P4 family phage/plasmid primase-like protien
LLWPERLPLEERDLKRLEASWITAELAAQAKLFRVDSITGAQLVGRNGKGDYSGVAIPYVLPGENSPREYRLRRDQPEIEYVDGRKKERNKYLTPPGRGNMLYFVPGTDIAFLSRVEIPIILAEGEFKTLSLWRAAWHSLGEAAEKPLFLPIGLSGVWCWRGTISKETGSDGARLDVKGTVSDLDRIEWRDRKVVIVFDRNVNTDDSVIAARAGLSKELRGRGAVVSWISWPKDCPEDMNGIDDFIHLRGPEEALLLIENALKSSEKVSLDCREYHLTDLGNARRLVAQHGHNLRYVAESGYHFWDGMRFTKDQTGHVMRFAKETILSLYSRAQGLDSTAREVLVKHALKSEAATRLKAMVELTATESEVATVISQLDSDPMVFNVLTWTIDLGTLEVREHRRADLISKLALVEFIPSAKCPMFLEFLNKIMKANSSLIRFLQKLFGYCLTGLSVEQRIWFFYGTGANGKTTLVKLIKTVLGEYALQTPIDTFLVKGNGQIPNDVARLKGARLVVAVEADEGRRLSESLVKGLTGGDEIVARFLHKEFFSFTPSSKVIIGTNHKPVIRGADHAIWRRIQLVPFGVTIPESEQDNDLFAKLANERSGILNWMLEGLRLWKIEGLGDHSEVRLATEEYRDEMDLVGQFLEECCLKKTRGEVEAGKLFLAFRKWCQNNGKDEISQTMFGLSLTEKGFQRKKDKTSRRTVYLGLVLEVQEPEIV